MFHLPCLDRTETYMLNEMCTVFLVELTVFAPWYETYKVNVDTEDVFFRIVIEFNMLMLGSITMNYP